MVIALPMLAVLLGAGLLAWLVETALDVWVNDV